MDLIKNSFPEQLDGELSRQRKLLGGHYSLQPRQVANYSQDGEEYCGWILHHIPLKK